ncbi:MAG: type II toxin-antitoxin system HicA family toxin, partial [Paracoccaceae bacterium]
MVAKKGSHHQFKHPEKTGCVTVPHPIKNIKTGAVRQTSPSISIYVTHI